MPAAPIPFHILRNHSSPLSALSINASNTLLYTGDQDGNVGVTDLSSRRVVRLWKAHNESVLSVEEWDGHLISHGRDNKIKMYEPLKLSGRLGQGMDKTKGLPIIRELDVNALNFCRFSVASAPCSSEEKGKGKEPEGILVVPSLLDSEYADIYHLPSFKRLHSSFNYVPGIKTPGASSSRTGLIMSIHSYIASDSGGSQIKVAMGFEDGRVELWALQEGVDWQDVSDARMGSSVWDKIYDTKKHNEAVMAMATNASLTKAWTVSADHQLVSYDLTSPSGENTKAWSTGHIGHASLALSPTESVLAIGGWDGHIRLFSAATGKPLGDLVYHRESVHVVAFAHVAAVNAGGHEVESTIELGDEDEDSDLEDAGDGQFVFRERWLVSGSKDRRVAMWELMDFASALK